MFEAIVLVFIYDVAYIILIGKMVMGSEDRLVSIKKSDLESLEATVETLQNQEVMKQLEKSERDIEEGRIRNVEKLLKELEG